MAHRIDRQMMCELTWAPFSMKAHYFVCGEIEIAGRASLAVLLGDY